MVVGKRSKYRNNSSRNYSNTLDTYETFTYGSFVENKKSNNTIKHYSSTGEQYVADWLVKNKIRFIREKEFTELYNPYTFSRLRLDFYIPDKMIAIEFDGSQHFKKSKLFDSKGSDTLEKRIYRDSIKDDFCLKNGITMIRIKYTDINNINEILSSYIV